MTLRESFEMIHHETRNEENLYRALELYEQTPKEDNLLYFDISVYLVDYYLEQDDFQSAIKISEDFIKAEIQIEYKKQLLMIDKLIGVLLKIEDFQKLEEVLQIRLRYSSEDKQANMMQYFYLAVCYEGLHRYHDAIDVLNNIPDTLSNNNLVSKYLKLAMLSIKTNQIGDALTHYQKAILFDPKKKNTMFYLVDSDIHYSNKEYLQALDSFQDFFLKSKTNLRYLDRFIVISLALEHFQEAYHFYQEYEPRVRQSISKSYQLQFYEAALEMFKQMNMTKEFLDIQDRVNHLSHHESSVIDPFSVVENLYYELSKIKDFDKLRDLYLHASRSFHQAMNPVSFHFFENDEDYFQMYTFRKHLLIEKKITKNAQVTFLDVLKSQTTRIEIYHPSSFGLYEDSNLQLFNNISLVICIKLSMNHLVPTYCFITLDNPVEFDLAYRLMSILSTWMNQQILHLAINKEQKDLNALLLQIPDLYHQAIIRFDKGKIVYFNPMAEELLPMIAKNDSFETIQKYIVSPQIYFDDFLTHREVEITIQINKDLIRNLHIKSIPSETNLLLVLEESNRAIDSKQTTSIDSLHNTIQSFQDLEEKYAKYDQASTMVYIDIAHFQETFKNASYSVKKEVEFALSSSYEELVKDFNLGLYSTNEGGWILWVKTIDKRVLQRIFNDTLKIIHRVNVNYQVYSFALPIQKNVPFHETIKTLFTYYYKYKTIDEIVIYERKYYSEVALRKSLLIHAEKLLEQDIIPLALYPVRKKRGEVDQGYFINMDPNAIFGDEEKILQTLVEYGLTKKYDEVIIKSLLKQKSIFDLLDGLGLLLLIHEEIIMDQSLYVNLLKRIKRRRVTEGKNIIIFDVSLRNEKSISDLIRLTQKEGFEVAIKIDEFHLIETLHLQTISNYIYVEDKDLDNLKILNSSLEKEVIYHHKGRNLLKSEIEDFNIEYLFGELYPYINM